MTGRLRKIGKKVVASAARDKKRATKLINPFGYTGSPVTELIKPEELDSILTQETLNDLADDAKIKSGLRVLATKPIDCREWFKGNVLSLAREFLTKAQEPGVRAISDELRHLFKLVEAAIWRCEPEFLSEPDDLETTLSAMKSYVPPRCDDVGDYVEKLSPQAINEITRHGVMPFPAIEELRRGDGQALRYLYGLVPINLEDLGASGELTYTGTGSRELTEVGRPPSVRIESFALQLCLAYNLATGKPPGRSARSPFMAFSSALMGCLCRSDEKFILIIRDTRPVFC